MSQRSGSVLRNPTATRVSTLIWVLALPMILGFFALSNIQNEVEFRTLQTFFILYLASGFGILLAMSNIFNIADSAKQLGAFWTNDIDGNGFKWILIGIIGVFAVAGITLTIGAGLEREQLLMTQVATIFLAGLVMLVAFLQTNALLVPIIIHGVYNSFVVFLRETGFALVGGSQQFDLAGGDPIFLGVNEVGVSLGGGFDLASEIVWQFTLVATAEEFLKLGVLILVVLLIHGAFKNRGLAVIAGGITSLIFWTNLHLIQALTPKLILGMSMLNSFIG